ncbi:T9SS type B sorting domain-containing protein [Adhaeribacter soli]|uniref:Gliding motility-associated C-terminal domain-containing protein n=1 Tax=Adhaeribacter soli TaxID=2607655 RepID=A0A5N1J1D0_9BACT|nr:gliding motility-associated C-terminal domain-containing protein [Adhaeribacter soli]KAA9340301.1 gliding motility-associated C-terminal domain-containing protein [Adhaeribacter soli]
MFGTKFHLDFNYPKPTVNTFSYLDTNAIGVASISDKTGNLLFFSSGGHVATRQKVNGTYQEMPNGDLTASFFYQSGTTAEMIVQSPADSNVYYLFYTVLVTDSTNYALDGCNLYSVQINMRLNNGYGDVVPNSRQLVRKNVNGGRLTALLHSNNRDTWVLCQGGSFPKNDSLSAHLVTPNGIMPAVKSKPAKPLGIFSRMKASPNSEMFVVLGEETQQGTLIDPALEVFDFNRSTGVPSHKYSLPPTDFWYPMASFAFSPDNSKLYVGTSSFVQISPNTTLYQFDLAAGNAAQVQQSRNVIYHTTDYTGVLDMQLAIDGKVYLLIDGYNKSNIAGYKNQYLSKINCLNSYGPACRFQFQGINLKAVNGGPALPALNQTIFRNAGKLQAQAYRNVICEGDSVQLSAYGAGAEQFKWKPANGLTSPADTLASPVVNPTATTTYMVIGSSVCRSDTAYVKVTVLPKLPGVSISGPVQVHSLSERQEYYVLNPAAGSAFNWQVNGGEIAEGQGTNRIRVNWGVAGVGSVSVAEIPATGCSGQRTRLTVALLDGPAPVIYNIITPNNDGKNDAFVIVNLEWYPQNELRIYNRWGMEVYHSKNYFNNWRGEKVSSGIYYYLFTANGKTWKGWVEVVK